MSDLLSHKIMKKEAERIWADEDKNDSENKEGKGKKEEGWKQRQ